MRNDIALEARDQYEQQTASVVLTVLLTGLRQSASRNNDVLLAFVSDKILKFGLIFLYLRSSIVAVYLMEVAASVAILEE